VSRKRQNLGLAQLELANAASVSSKMISDLELGNTRKPTPENLLNVIKALRFDEIDKCQLEFERTNILHAFGGFDASLSNMPLTTPSDERLVANLLIEKWAKLPDCARAGRFLIEGGEVVYFKHLLRLFNNNIQESVLCFIRLGQQSNYAAFKMPELYNALAGAVRDRKMVIGYVFLLPKRSYRGRKDVINFLRRYKPFASSIGLLFEDSPQLPREAVKHSIVILTHQRIVLTHDRTSNGKMVNPMQLMSADDYDEESKHFQTIVTASEPYFSASKRLRGRPT
jgi:transcriptional regulator with XRE-family HTH domain